MTPTVLQTAPEEDTVMVNGIPSEDIRTQLQQILRSRSFVQSHRIRKFLQFIVEESILGQPQRLKEYLIGLEVFERREAFDPRVDSIVRVEARRLRTKLDEYYRSEGREDNVRILLRKGSYVPIFEHRSAGSGFTPHSHRRAVEIAPLTLVNVADIAKPVAEELQRRLAHVFIKEGGFQVTVRAQAGVESPELTGTAPAVKPDYILEGSIELQGDMFHLLLQLMQAGDGAYVFSEAIDGNLQDLSTIDPIAQSMMRELTASGNDSGSPRRHAAHKESCDLYLEGRYFWKLADPDSIRNSISFFSRAVESDENYAAAWAALSEALLVSAMFGLAPNDTPAKMKDAASKAASLNPHLPEAHVALGSVLSLMDWDWIAGEQALEKAIQLDSHDPVGHIAFGIQLACRGMLDRAVSEVERGLELDPASLFGNFVMGWLYGVCRRFEESMAQHQLVARFAPDYGLAHLGLGLAAAGQGQFADAIAHLTNASQLKCRSLLHGLLGYCYAMANRKEEALREVATLNERAGTQHVSPVSFAAIYSGLGDRERALEYLEKAVDVHDTSLPVHLLNPEFDNLRNEPRFLALRQRIGVSV
jgi:tetratricopeptide (TPR) repeat protein